MQLMSPDHFACIYFGLIGSCVHALSYILQIQQCKRILIDIQIDIIQIKIEDKTDEHENLTHTVYIPKYKGSKQKV